MSSGVAHAAQGNPSDRALARLFRGDAGELGFGLHALGDALGLGRPRIEADDPDTSGGIGRGQTGRGQHQRGIGGPAGEMGRRGDLAAIADHIDDHPPAPRLAMRFTTGSITFT